jgi:hypothetical protein
MAFAPMLPIDVLLHIGGFCDVHTVRMMFCAMPRSEIRQYYEERVASAAEGMWREDDRYWVRVNESCYYILYCFNGEDDGISGPYWTTPPHVERVTDGRDVEKVDRMIVETLRFIEKELDYRYDVDYDERKRWMRFWRDFRLHRSY